MGVLKELGSLANVVGEARRATNFFKELALSKAKFKALQEDLQMERRRRQELESAIRKHRKEMQESTYPRKFDCDQDLWKLIEDTIPNSPKKEKKDE